MHPTILNDLGGLMPSFTPARSHSASSHAQAEPSRSAQDRVSLGRSVEGLLGFLGGRLNRALDQLASAESAGRDRAAEPGTPEAVAGQVVPRGHRLAAAGQDPAAIRGAIDQGFDETRDLLDAGRAPGGIGEALDRTRALIDQGLRHLGGEGTRESAFDHHSSSRSESRSLEIRTRDGDVVTIQFTESTASSRSRVLSREDGAGVYAFEQRQSLERSMSYTVEGQLDEEERAAIDELVQAVDSVADDFVNGDEGALLSRAGELAGFNDEVLAGFRAEFHYEETRSRTAGYERVETGADSVDRLARALDRVESEDHDRRAQWRELADRLVGSKADIEDRPELEGIRGFLGALMDRLQGPRPDEPT